MFRKSKILTMGDGTNPVVTPRQGLEWQATFLDSGRTAVMQRGGL